MHVLLLLAGCGPALLPLGEDPVGDDGASASVAPAEAEVPDAEVDCDGGSDFERIQDAIDAATSGDLIHVAPCTYDESIDFGGKTLRIVATGGAEVTTISARSGHPVVTAALGEGTGTSVEGFTLTGGSGMAAVNADFSSLRLVDDIVTDNRGYYTLLGSSADLELSNVQFSDNSASYGVAVYVDRGALVASDVTIACGSETYGVFVSHASAILDRADVTCRSGYATYWNHAVGRLQRSTTTGTNYIEAEEDHYDDTVYFINDVLDGQINATYGTTVVRNSILTGGLALTTAYTATTVEGSILTDAACAINSDVAELVVRNNLFWGVGANGCGLFLDPVGTNDNTTADPLFTDEAGGDYTLTARSPGVDAGPDEAAYVDIDGSRNDIGVYGGPFSIGGGY